MTPNGRQEVMERRFRAWDLVLDEQEFQMSKGVVDEERIAHLYGKSCRDSQEDAYERGLTDQRAALQDQERSSSLRMVMKKKNDVSVVQRQQMNTFACNKTSSVDCSAKFNSMSHNRIMSDAFQNLPQVFLSNPADDASKTSTEGLLDLLSLLSEVENTLALEL